MFSFVFTGRDCVLNSTILCNLSIQQNRQNLIYILFAKTNLKFVTPKHTIKCSYCTFISIASTDVSMMLYCITSVHITAFIPPCKREIRLIIWYDNDLKIKTTKFPVMFLSLPVQLQKLVTKNYTSQFASVTAK